MYSGIIFLLKKSYNFFDILTPTKTLLKGYLNNCNLWIVSKKPRRFRNTGLDEIQISLCLNLFPAFQIIWKLAIGSFPLEIIKIPVSGKYRQIGSHLESYQQYLGLISKASWAWAKIYLTWVHLLELEARHESKQGRAQVIRWVLSTPY